MSAPNKNTKKARRIKRKAPLSLQMVTFEVPDLFEGEFTMPDLNQLPLGSVRKLQSVDGLDEMFRLCDEYKREEEKLALDELGADEVEVFVEAWSSASKIDLPKSDG